MGKTTNKKLIIFMIMIFCMFISFYSYRVNANQSNNIIQYNPDVIKILEIQPGNKFYLGNATYDSTIGELPEQNVTATNGESKRVAITHMPMTQFISMVDELNGQYDVVVLGRRIDGLEQKYSGDTALGTQYRDYTNPTTQKKGYLPQLWWGQTEAHKNNVQNDISVIDGAKMTEYYAENDITDKRAKEIIKMIQNDQLVYVDYDIYPSKKPNKSTDGVANASAYKEINETKLYKTFDTDNFDYPIWVSDSVENREYNTWKQKIKLKSLSSYNNNSFLKEIVDDYINNSSDNKRPKIKQLKTPKSDEKSSEKGEKKNRDMDYTITMGQNGHFKLKLYLDINGDGLFKENELSVTKEFDSDSDNYEYSFRYTLNNDFVGYLDWKIEVISYEDKNKEIKTNLFGSSQYKALNEKKHIKVLQIKPNADYVKLEGNSAFENILNDNCVVNDYTIEVNTKTIKEVNEEMNKEKKDRKWQINGDYDMVIIGFGDGFGVYSDVYEDFNDSAINELKEFIKTGQSVMFTHDTMAPVFAYESILDSNNNKIITGSQNLTRNFRDYIGQSRYRDIYRSKDINNINGKIDLTDGDGKINDFDEIDLVNNKIIPHDDYPDSAAYSVGTALQNNRWESEITKVSKINKAQINQYPFELNDEINVLSTHTQWFQLNLEDEDVVPWFNLKSNSNKFDNLDSRNNYYTYSKGNITYCGTGHIYGSSDFTNEEMKLFINTIVKAERGSNHKPDIICSMNPLNKGENHAEYNKDYYFSVDSSDYDYDMVKIHITIDGQEISDDNIISDIEIRNEEGKKNFDINTLDSYRKSIKFRIPAEKLRESFNNKSNISIKIDAVDIKGAKSEEKEYNLVPIETSSSIIEAKLESSTPNPTESKNNITVKYKITPNDYYYYKNNEDKPIDEAILLVDLSAKMNGNQRFSQLQNGITSILNNTTLQNTTKFGVVGFNKDVYVGCRSNMKDEKSSTLIKVDSDLNNSIIRPLYSIKDSNERDGYRLFFQQSILSDVMNSSTDNERNFKQGLKVADKILTKYGDVEKQKAIVIVSSGNLSYDNDIEIQKIIKKGYKVIILDISADDDSNLLNAYKNLGGYVSINGEPQDYFLGTFNDESNYNSVNNDMQKVAESLLHGIKYKNMLSNARLKFNLGNNFSMVSDKTDEGNDINNSNNNIYNIDISDKIIYTPNYEDKNDYGQVRYSAQPFYVTFKIKATKDNGNNYGFSNLTFTNQEVEDMKLLELGTDQATNNQVIYSEFDEEKAVNIFTPVIKIKSSITKLKHGLYQSITNEADNIIDEAEHSFAKGIQVMLGAYIEGATNGNNVELTVDGDNAGSVQPIVYSVNNTNEKRKIGELYFNNDTKKYTGIINGLEEDCNRILILYEEVLPETSGEFTNIISVDEFSRPYKIKVNTDSPELLDLF